MPKDRINLTVDRAALERARRYSARHGTSISRLVTQFLGSLPEEPSLEEEHDVGGLSPRVRRLLGIARAAGDANDYRRHLEDKYGR